MGKMPIPPRKYNRSEYELVRGEHMCVGCVFKDGRAIVDKCRVLEDIEFECENNKIFKRIKNDGKQEEQQ